jgi:hypothetical protein
MNDVVALNRESHQSHKQMIGNEIKGNKWDDAIIGRAENLNNHVRPAFLSDDLKHGHESLKHTKIHINIHM